MHVHADHYHDINLAVDQCKKHGILAWSCAMDVDSYERSRTLLADAPQFFLTFGMHPWEVKNWDRDWETLTINLNKSPHIGEVGIDYHWEQDRSFDTLQYEVFEFIVSHASKSGKWLNVHTKGAEKEVFEILNRYQCQKVIIHWYSGPEQWFHKMADLGCMFTFGVELNRNEYLQMLFKKLPGELILAETDGPGGMEWLTGKKGEPMDIISVYEAMSEIRKFDLDDLKMLLKKNAAKIFIS